MDALQVAAKKRARNKLARYLPYPKQWEFLCAGIEAKERLLMASNRAGKTLTASDEMAIHATGRYPDWWSGKRFEHPVTVWTGAETNELSRKVSQKMLLGSDSTSMKDPAMGTGAIPGNAIIQVHKRQAGIQDVADSIRVKNEFGGYSTIHLKTYEQGRKTFQGQQVHVVWLDEEPPVDIYNEALTRTMDVNGILFMTFTPLLGMSDVVKRYLQPSDVGVRRSVTNMTIDDCIGGVWPEGTPWAGMRWTGHFTREEADAVIATYAEHERDTRAYGVPMMGEGRVYPLRDTSIACDAFDIPRHFARISGIDFGFHDPCAVVWLAWDRDADIVYVYDCYKRKEETSAYHIQTLHQKDPGADIPVAWPHDGLKRDARSGRPLWRQYRNEQVPMLPMSARYEDDIGGAQPKEPVVLEILERMKTGRFKVFRHLGLWFEEFRVYHRKDGRIYDRSGDDLMQATEYAIMMLRKARIPMSQRPVRRSRYTRPVVGGVL